MASIDLVLAMLLAVILGGSIVRALPLSLSARARAGFHQAIVCDVDVVRVCTDHVPC